jgi:Sulfotransferase family
VGVSADPRLLGVCCYELSITKQSDSKSRWVDGTPEYSFYICGLRKLFPGALFIHIVRDVDSVVRSLLNFDRLAGGSLVANEQQAYEKWLRTVESCRQAERAYGSQVVYRLQYSDLINNPESALRSVLKFLGERYVPACLEPLRLRINSSNVPASFDASDPKTDPAVVEKARRLSTELEKDSKHVGPSALATNEMETAFDQRVRDVSQLAKKVIAKDLVISGLQKEFDERTAWALCVQEEIKSKDLVISSLQKEFDERTDWALRLKGEVKAKDVAILRLKKELDERTASALRWKEKVKAKDLVIVGLHKRLSRRPIRILKRILRGKSWS